MDQSSRVNLLIVETSRNEAEELIKTLRRAGYAPRPEFAQDREDMEEVLGRATLDIVLASMDVEDFPISMVLELIQGTGRQTPVIGLLERPDPERAIAAMAAGARDTVVKEQGEHFELVFARELEYRRLWQSFRRSEANYQELQRFNRTLMDSSRDAIAYVTEGMHVYANPAYLNLLGFSEFEEIDGTPLIDLAERDEQKRLRDFLRALPKQQGKGEFKTRLRHADAKGFGVQMEFSPTTFGGEPCTQITVRDESDASELKEQINYLKKRDLLTGLYNRQYFMDELGQVARSAAKGESKAALLNVTVDEFSGVRDQVGASSSDLVLQDIGKVIEQTAGNGAMVARLEGESYSVMYPNVSTDAELRTRAEAILRTVEDHICDVGGVSISVTCHIGGSMIDETAPEAGDILRRAESAAKAAAAKGGNTYSLYQPKSGELSQAQQDKQWVEALRKAMEQDRLHLVFQPIVSVNGEPGERYEVLLRMVDTKGEIVRPGEFLPAAERGGYAKEIDQWVFAHALDLLGQERASGRNLLFFLKLSFGSLTSAEFLPWLAEQLKQRRIPGKSLVCQVKESVAVTHINHTKTFTKGLKQLNSALALDDFGTSSNPFQVLKHIQVDYLKLDCSLSAGLAKRQTDQETVRNLIEGAHNNAKEVIAPCIEDPQSLALLWSMNINYIEGNFLQQPGRDLTFDFSSMGLL